MIGTRRSHDGGRTFRATFQSFWLCDWAGLVVLAMVAGCLALIGLALSGRLSDAVLIRLASLAFGSYLPLAAIITACLARQPGLPRAARRAWWLLAAGDIVYWAGAIAWSLTASDGQAATFSSWFNLFFIASYPLFFLALRSFPRRPLPRAQALTAWLDIAVVLISATAYVWYVVIGPFDLLRNVVSANALIALFYPLADLVLLTGVVSLLYRGPADSEEPLGILAIGLALLTAGDIGWAEQAQQGASQPTFAVLASWAVAALLLALSPHYQRARLRRSSRGTTRQYPNLLPYVATGASFVLLVAVALPSVPLRLGGALIALPLVAGLLLIRQVVTLRQNAGLLRERIAREADLHFRSLVQNSSDAITVIAPDLVILYQSPSIERLFGHHPADLIGSSLLTLAHPDDAAGLAALVGQAGPGRDVHLPVSWRIRRGDDAWCHVETVATNLLREPSVQGIVLNTRDVSERKRLEEQLAHRAFHDPLTDLPNRTLFMDRLSHGLERTARRQEPLAVLFLDLDNFKSVNDRYGHQTGDRLLQAVAKRLAAVTRGSDTAARLAGDEFTVLIEELDDADDARLLAERVARALALPFDLDGIRIESATSIGVAIASPEDTPESLLRHADLALYRAKHLGRARCELFEPALLAADAAS